jgi:1,4-dihydroxy-2-naphthoate octaprenyltransferase
MDGSLTSAALCVTSLFSNTEGTRSIGVLEKETNIMAKIEDWLGMSHPPFHNLGVIPFCLGTFLAWRLDRVFNVTVFALGIIGIVMVMFSTRHAGEYIARTVDERSKRPSRNPFAGGAYAILDRIFRRPGPLRTSFTAIATAFLIGTVLQFTLKTGPFTLLLGCLGALPGLFYATRPARPVDNGFGEILIAFCYSWLPIAAAFYIQRGYIAPCIHWMALPIGLSIFNVVLLNEFPAHAANPAGGSTNLLGRLGAAKGTALYCLTSILSWFVMYSSLNEGIPRKALYIYLPVMALSAVISLMMAGKRYQNPFVLEILCGLNIAVHLGTAAAYFLAFL